MTVDRDYCLELFKAIEPLDIVWMTSLEPSFAEDKELVEAAARSGLRNLLLGIETPSREVLSDNKKGQLDLEKLKGQIAYLHSFDIEIDSAMLFGFDQHDSSIFQETLEFALDIDLDVTHGVVPIPFPGTELYESLDKAGRLTTKDWSKYDGSWLVYTHNHFSVTSLYEGIMWYEKEFLKRHKKRNFKWHRRWDNNQTPRNIQTETVRETRSTSEINYNMPSNKKDIKWKSILAIIAVVGGIIMDWPLLFGILYIFWALLDIRTGHAYIIEDIPRSEHPILFWTIVMIWLFSGSYIVTAYFLGW